MNNIRSKISLPKLETKEQVVKLLVLSVLSVAMLIWLTLANVPLLSSHTAFENAVNVSGTYSMDVAFPSFLMTFGVLGVFVITAPLAIIFRKNNTALIVLSSIMGAALIAGFICFGVVNDPSWGLSHYY